MHIRAISLKSPRLGFLALFIFSTIGCDSGAPSSLDGGSISTVKVSGKVLAADGKPVSKGILVLEPIEGSSTNASSEIQPDGSFKLMTRSPEDGAAPGKYRVRLDESPVKLKVGNEPTVEIKEATSDLTIKLP